MNERRVAIFVTGLGAGGAEHMLCKLVEAAHGTDTQFMIISLLDDGMFGERIRASGAVVVCCNLNRIVGIKHLPRVISTLRKFRPTVLQGWMYHGNLLASLLRLFTPGRPKLFWSIRQTLNSLSGEPPQFRLIIYLLALLSRRVCGIIYNSSISVQQHRALGITSNADMMIPNGFDSIRYRPNVERGLLTRERLGIGDGPLVGLVARVHPLKDHACFFAAAGKILTAIPSARFLLAGEGTDTPEMHAALKSRGILEQTVTLGRVTHTEELYPALDLLVVSSRGESWPNVIGEAMASGIVVVSTDVGEAGNIIGDTGEVVPPSHPIALAAACLRILALPAEERRALGKRAHDRILHHYDIHEVYRQYVRAWDETP